jgi:hypothetical protein
MPLSKGRMEAVIWVGSSLYSFSLVNVIVQLELNAYNWLLSCYMAMGWLVS